MHSLDNVPTVVKHAANVFCVDGAREVRVAEVAPVARRCADFLQTHKHRVYTCTHVRVRVLVYAAFNFDFKQILYLIFFNLNGYELTRKNFCEPILYLTYENGTCMYMYMKNVRTCKCALRTCTCQQPEPR